MSFGQSTKGTNESVNFICDSRPLEKNAQRRLNDLVESGSIFQNLACHNLKGIELDDILVENAVQPNLPLGDEGNRQFSGLKVSIDKSRKKGASADGKGASNPYEDDENFGRMPCYLHKIALSIAEHTVHFFNELNHDERESQSM